jgi:hypothetical protein
VLARSRHVIVRHTAHTVYTTRHFHRTDYSPGLTGVPLRCVRAVDRLLPCIDDYLTAATAARCRQVVLLAAGLYTRAFRSGWRPDGTLWVTATHHISFSLGFALQQLGSRIINNLVWEKPDPVPNALHTAFTHLKAVEPVPAGAFPRSLDKGTDVADEPGAGRFAVTVKLTSGNTLVKGTSEIFTVSP